MTINSFYEPSEALKNHLRFLNALKLRGKNNRNRISEMIKGLEQEKDKLNKETELINEQLALLARIAPKRRSRKRGKPRKEVAA